MTTTEDRTAVLDISGAVSESDYRRVYNNLYYDLLNWRRASGWCTDFFVPMRQLSLTFRYDRNDDYIYLDWSQYTTDEARGQDLRELRGRILRFTIDRPAYLSPEKANEFLVNAGLAPYTPAEETEAKRKKLFYVAVNAYVDTELDQAEVEAKIRRSFTRMGAATRSDNDHVALEVIVREQNPQRSSGVPATETVPLLRAARSYG